MPRPPFRVLIAPDGYKHSMPPTVAAHAIAKGARRAADALSRPIHLTTLPISDGGEGFVEALANAWGVTHTTTTVTGPVGDPVEAAWCEAQGTLALEVATTAGIQQVPPQRRDPTTTTSAGLGDALRFAADRKPNRILIGLGSSATVDGGIGMAAALGWSLLDESNSPLPPTPQALPKIHRITPPSTNPLAGIEILAAADVDNPLLGANGAAPVFGPQKGATPAQVRTLEAGLAALAKACARTGITADPNARHAGAAGGLGFGCRAFLDGQVVAGAPLVLDAVGFDRALAAADLIITGEGRLDATTLQGKAVAVIARRAHDRKGPPTIALVGAIDPGGTPLLSPNGPLTEAHAITPYGMPLDDALTQGPALLEAAAERAVRRFLER